MIGLPRDKIIGCVCHRFVCPGEEGNCPITDQGKEIDREERILLDREGSEVPILKTVTSITIKGRHHLLESFIDITDLKQAREALGQSEREKAIILDSLDEMVVFQDREMRLIWGNRAAAESVGMEQAQIQGRRCYEVWHQRAAPCEICPVLEATKTGSPRESEVVSPDGRVWFIRGYPVSDEKGNIIGAVEITQNITGRKRAEEALLRHSLVYRSMQEAVLIFDPEDRIIDINPATEKMFGWSRDELMGRKADCLNPSDRVGEIASVIRQGLDKNGVWEGEIPIITKGGEPRIMSTIVSSIYDRAGAWIGNVGINRDITQRKRIEEALQESERQHRAVVENANEAIVVAQDGLIQFFNPKTVEMTGYSPVELNLIPVTDLVHPEDREMVSGRHQRRIKGEKVTPVYSFRLVTRDGRTRWVEINAVLFDWEGRPATLNFLSDITERKEATEALRESRERFRVAAECASDLIYEWDFASDTLEWYGDIDRALGYDPGGFPRTLDGWLSAIHPDDLPRMEEAVRKQREGSRSVHTEYRIRGRDGDWLQWIDRGTVILDKNGKPVRMIGVCTDVTLRRRLEGEVLKTQKLESLGVLAGGIAHDFNNLLMSIMGNISLAKLSLPEDTDIGATLGEAEASCMQAKNLTQQLLTFSRGGLPIKKTIFISDLIRESTKMALSGSNSKAVFSIADDLRPVEADSGQMHQVINNLIINAVQAMPGGGLVEIGAKNISVTDETGLPLKEGSYVRLSVRDHGMGIPDKYIDNIFDPYFTTKKQGSGLGLATVYSITKNHEGLITVDSDPDSGTVFTLYLPASGREPEPTAHREQQIVREGRKILLMDDDDSVRTVCRQMLENLGYEIETARDGKEAVKTFRRAKKDDRPFSCAILDLTVKDGMGGKETAGELKKIDPGIRIVVTSGYSTDAIMAEHEKHGFHGVIVKPYNVKDLSAVLSRVMNDGDG